MANSGCKDVTGPDEESFLYFAYGSNLLTERIHLRNPSAAFFCVARLQDFKLDFGNSQGKTSQTWHGGIATIFQSPGDEVWGVVWKMNKSNLNSLDEQEGVKSGMYVVIEVKVATQEGKEITCRSYLMTNYESAPPSPQYKKVEKETSHCLSESGKSPLQAQDKNVGYRDPKIPVQNLSLALCWQAQSGHGTCNRLFAWVQKKMVCRWSIKRS
ncbi:gamma-glutamylcyclotransferase isoform X1 [Gorilla gorilla gorilla]|nr:gamma-glutamylcyclotransferase isoform X1 [Gorilla gorilla gorilla]